VNYYDRAGNPIDTDTFRRMWPEQQRVAFDRIGDADISTVWLGLDHNFNGEGPPQVFESMVFGGRHDQGQQRYATEQAALFGHSLWVAHIEIEAEHDRLEAEHEPIEPKPNARPEQRVLDAIDQLVNDQLADGEPRTGYDYGDPQYPPCPHCDEKWHGLAITQHMTEMRWRGELDPGYDHATDTSPVVCPGSRFIGPMPRRKPPTRLPLPPLYIVEVGVLDEQEQP
jgi:hypothetical protein